MKLKKRIALSLIGIIAILYIYISVNVSAYKPLEVNPENISIDDNVCKGAIHIHSVRSDGTGDIHDIAAAAKEAGLDFIVLTDHDASTGARDDAGYVDSILILVGSEVSVPEAHVLYIPHPDSVFYDISYVKENLYSLTSQAIVMVAHPFLPKRPLKKDTAHLTDGIEIVNFDCIWRGAPKWSVLSGFLMYPFLDYAMNIIAEFSFENQDLWESKVRAGYDDLKFIGSVDAHANVKITKEYSWEFPSYTSLFRLLQTHVITEEELTGDYEHDSVLIYNALKRGISYVTYEGLGRTDGFKFVASGVSKNYNIGSVVAADSVDSISLLIPAKKNVKIVLKTPEGIVKSVTGPEMIFENPGPGVYFAEIYQLRRATVFGGEVEVPWIKTNPIIIKE